MLAGNGHEAFNLGFSGRGRLAWNRSPDIKEEVFHSCMSCEQAFRSVLCKVPETVYGIRWDVDHLPDAETSPMQRAIRGLCKLSGALQHKERFLLGVLMKRHNTPRRYGDLQGAISSACISTAEAPFAHNAHDVESVICCFVQWIFPFLVGPA